MLIISNGFRTLVEDDFFIVLNEHVPPVFQFLAGKAAKPAVGYFDVVYMKLVGGNNFLFQPGCQFIAYQNTEIVHIPYLPWQLESNNTNLTGAVNAAVAFIP